MGEEMLEIVDDSGNVIGTAPRSVIHGNPGLMHKVVHVLVFTSEGKLLLQKRSMNKDVAPGKWDTSVGGHVEPGEPVEDAVKREMLEEIGISKTVEYLYKYIHRNDHETELVYTYMCTHDGDIRFDSGEIDEVMSWGLDEIRSKIDSGIFSINFIHEFQTYLEHRGL